MTRCSGPDLHFFDGEKYSVCPVCGYPAATKEDDEKLLMLDAYGKTKIDTSFLDRTRCRVSL